MGIRPISPPLGQPKVGNEVREGVLNGRLYDPLLGRMLSADNYVQAAGNTQSYNRYSYVHKKCAGNRYYYSTHKRIEHRLSETKNQTWIQAQSRNLYKGIFGDKNQRTASLP
jgi:hypothetical protein